jgi:hypothetical protein
LAPSGVALPTSPFHLTVPDHLTVVFLPTADSELVGTAPMVSNSLASGHTTLENLLNTLAPTTVETLHPVPIPTFQGRSPIIRESSTYLYIFPVLILVTHLGKTTLGLVVWDLKLHLSKPTVLRERLLLLLLFRIIIPQKHLTLGCLEALNP